MNIEEERKAFEEKFKPDEGVKWSVTKEWYYVEDPSWDEGLRETVNYFQGWLAAKEHAVEMAKPACILEAFDDGYRLRLSWRPNDFLLFRKEENARAWAKANGYRVVAA